MLSFILLTGFAVMIGGLFYFIFQLEKKRRAAFNTFAAANQMLPWPAESSRASIHAYWLFATANDAVVKNGYYKVIGNTHFCIGDVSYIIGYGKGRQHYEQTFLMVVQPQLMAPPCTIVQRGLINAMMRKGEGGDVPLPHVPGFDDKWRLISPLAPQAEQFINPASGAVIMQSGEYWWKITGTQIMVFESRKKQKTEELASWLQKVSLSVQQMLATQGLQTEIPYWTQPQ